MSKYDPMDSRNPWETAKEGSWVVIKSDGCTRMTKVENPALAEVEVALAVLYDGIIKAVHENLEKNRYFISPHDYVIAGIEHLRKEINNGKGTL